MAMSAAQKLANAAKKAIERTLTPLGFSRFRWVGKEVRAFDRDEMREVFVSFEINDEETRARIKSVFPRDDARLADLIGKIAADVPTRRNPAPRGSVASAARLAARFHGRQPEESEITEYKKPAIPDAMAGIGEVYAIEYLAERDGKVYRFRHQFKAKSRPQLAVSPDGKFCTMLGGAWEFTEDGFEDF